MRTTQLLLLTAAAMASQAQAQVATERIDPQLQAVRESYYKSFNACDMRAVDEIEASNWRMIADYPQRRVIKPQDQGGGEPCQAGGTVRDVDVEVRTFGNVAIVSGQEMSTEPDGNESVGFVTEVWVNQNGRWRIAHLHVSTADLVPNDGGGRR